MFRPNTYCQLSRKSGRDVFGQQKLAVVGTAVPCAVVTLAPVASASPVRADSSASHAASEMMTAAVMILFPASVAIAYDDIVEVVGVRARVTGVQPRLNVMGRLDHFEVTGELAPVDDA